MEEFYTVEQIAGRLHVTPRTVREWLGTQQLHGVKAGRQWRITVRDLEAFLRQPGRQEPAKEGL
jgi:excisionase family DNA binding protein